jgi:3-oxoadipate enol-lactonase
LEMLKTTVNGFEIAYERIGAGTPLVLIHGYPLDHTIWDLVVPLLEPHFDLILPDLRGFGRSGTTPHHFQLDDMAADIAALLDGLKINKAAIAGHSMGGYVSLAFARAHPGRMLGLGLVASQSVADTPEKKTGRTREAETVLANGVAGVAEGMSPRLTADPGLQAKLRDLMLKQRPQGVAGALRAMAGRLDSTSILSGFNFPVVIVHGLADKIIPVERAREMRAAVKQGCLFEIAAAGHMPMMEAPQDTAEALLKLA